MKAISPAYRYVYPIENDRMLKGFFFYIDNDQQFGIFNASLRNMTPTKRGIVELRMLSDGSLRYRIGDSLYVIKKDQKIENITKWSKALEDSTMVLSHFSLNGDQLIISPGNFRISRDANGGLVNHFLPGAGVMNFSDLSWEVAPTYHSIIPYQDFYVAINSDKDGNVDKLRTLILDKKFKINSKKAFGASFIINGMLIMKDLKKKAYVKYNVTKNKKTKIGAFNGLKAAYHLYNGYLMIGDYYSGIYSNGAAIKDILTPSGNLVEVPLENFVIDFALPEDLIIVSKLLDSNMPVKSQGWPQKAIFDLHDQKFLTPWCESIYPDTNRDFPIAISILFKENEKKDGFMGSFVSYGEMREYFEKRYGNSQQ